jgi:antitoxin ParD1/3/4
MANVSLGEYYEKYVQDQVMSGRFTSASEVIREALRLHEERQQFRQGQLDALRQDIAAGIRDLDEGRVSTRSMREIVADLEQIPERP